MATTEALFEPYRNPVTPSEICDCLGKLLEVRSQLQRKANRENRRFPLSEWPALWVLTPTASKTILEGLLSAFPKRLGSRSLFLSSYLKNGDRAAPLRDRSHSSITANALDTMVEAIRTGSRAERGDR